MVRLDHSLLATARGLITAANIQAAQQLIFSYEQAVVLHNQRTAGHLVYQDIHEKELRTFTRIATEMRAQAARLSENRADLEQRQTAMQERSRTVMRHAREAIANAEQVQERSLQLNLRIDKALQLIAGLDKEEA